MAERKQSVQEEQIIGTEQEQRKKAPFFAIVGAPAVGKTALLDLMTTSLGIQPVQEKFAGNKELVKFYTSGRPQEHSFKAQMFFLGLTIAQTRSYREVLLRQAIVQDQGMEGNMVIADTQHKLGDMTDIEFSMYTESFNLIVGAQGFPKPDIYIALTAEYEIIKQRIIDRGREMELQMMQSHPNYFPSLVENFDNWLREKTRRAPVIVIDTGKVDICEEDKRDFLVKEICDWSTYYLTSPNQLGGKSQDGTSFILPDFALHPRLFYRSKSYSIDKQRKQL
ncbi:deoxynucleoside kinase [Patescibacteria group bacterium]|nr:deoxynucleoside kinase [Patescibacteria group bacterium]